MHVTDLSDLPPAALAAIGALVLVQVSLQVWGLIDLARRKRVLGGRKWVWLLVILFGEIVGVIVYLAVGRSVPPDAQDPLAAAPTDDADRAQRAADLLYGKR
ncbi:MAG TPA: PLD nuclease N-terminal domain-containing protein [Coriobacteriia bacterium]|jgi:hypothetical protein